MSIFKRGATQYPGVFAGALKNFDSVELPERSIDMEAVNAYYDGHTFVPIQPIKVKKNQKAIVTILDETIEHGKKSLLDFAGVLSKEDGAAMLEAIKDAERIDNEW
jgi:hypothetical protein